MQFMRFSFIMYLYANYHLHQIRQNWHNFFAGWESKFNVEMKAVRVSYFSYQQISLKIDGKFWRVFFRNWNIFSSFSISNTSVIKSWFKFSHRKDKKKKNCKEKLFLEKIVREIIFKFKNCRKKMLFNLVTYFFFFFLI